MLRIIVIKGYLRSVYNIIIFQILTYTLYVSKKKKEIFYGRL